MPERASPKAPMRADGTYLYVVSMHSWGKTTTRLEAAMSLVQAKELHGWTRNRYESRRVHRATIAEVASFAAWEIPAVESEKDDNVSEGDGHA